MKNAIAGAMTATIMLLLSVTLFSLSEYHVGILSAITMMCWVWVLIAAIQQAAERGPRRDWGLDPEDDAAPRNVRVYRTQPRRAALPAPQSRRLQQQAERREYEADICAARPNAGHAAELERHRQQYMAAMAAIINGTRIDDEDDYDIGEWEDDINDIDADPMARALAAIPGAVIYPPELHDGDGYGVIVLSADPALIEAARAAVCSLRGHQIYFIAGLAPMPATANPASRTRNLWSHSYLDGELFGPEPVKIQGTYVVFSAPRSYWLVLPANWRDMAGGDAGSGGDLMLAEARQALTDDRRPSSGAR